jgi:hypothetical protein
MTAHPNQRRLSSLPVELRRPPVPEAVRSWIARETGAAVVRIRRLPGASSTAVHGLYLSNGTRLALRRYVWPGFLEDEPVAPVRELEALRFAFSRGLQVPEVLAADPTGEEVGDGVPGLSMSFLPGRAVGVPDLDRLAEVAASIHDVAPEGFSHDYFPWYQSTTHAPPAAARTPALWEKAIETWLEAMPTYQPRFVHRDFHSGNVVWTRRKLSGVVDWANACRGPWGCDIAHCRDNLITLSGQEAADRFLDAYESVTGRTYHPYWEIASVLEHGPSHRTPQHVANSEKRLDQALRCLATPPRRRGQSQSDPRSERRT